MRDLDELHRYWNYGHESGGGSVLDACLPYVGLVADLVRREGVRTAVDLGCGDGVLHLATDWGDADVLGVDGSARHVARLSAENPGRRFLNADLETFDASGFDLGVMKDVLQHWPTDRIMTYLRSPLLPRLLLLTNDVDGGTINGDIPYHEMRDGRLQVAVRGLDLNAPPFSVGGEELLRFSGKCSLLLRRPV